MKEWKAPEKEAQKMTRDGAVSVNLVTGETTYPSDRTLEQDYSASGDTAGVAGKAVDRAELHREQAAAKKKRRKQRRAYREGEAAASRPSSRLQFSEADRATPELQGAIRKSDKAADRLDAAGDCFGTIAYAPQGDNGFGYDPVFFVPELRKTFAQLTPEEKNAISHRGNALRAFAAELKTYLEKN